MAPHGFSLAGGGLLAPSPHHFPFTEFSFSPRAISPNEVHQITTQGLITHLEVAHHPHLTGYLIARLDDSQRLEADFAFLYQYFMKLGWIRVRRNTKSPGPKPPQILMVLRILSPAVDKRTWAGIFGLGDISVDPPFEVVLADLERVRPWAFKRRRLYMSRYSPQKLVAIVRPFSYRRDPDFNKYFASPQNLSKLVVPTMVLFHLLFIPNLLFHLFATVVSNTCFQRPKNLLG